MTFTQPYIIAEIASSHEGDPALAHKLIQLAANTGADAVKLQIFHRDSLISKVHPKYASFGEIEIAPEQWRVLLETCKQLPIDTIVEVYDLQSLALAEQYGNAIAYKIPGSDLDSQALLRAAGATAKPLLLGTGGSTWPEIQAAVANIRRYTAAPIILMQGIQTYPTAIADCELAMLERCKSLNCLLGYADHVDAEQTEMTRVIPAMAMAAGAIVIEKHLTDDRARKGRDHYSALNPDEFANFVTFLRATSKAIPDRAEQLSEAGNQYRNMMKKQAVAAKALAVGDVVAADCILFKRIGIPGLTESQIPAFVGKRLQTPVVVDQPLLAENFEA